MTEEAIVSAAFGTAGSDRRMSASTVETEPSRTPCRSARPARRPGRDPPPVPDRLRRALGDQPAFPAAGQPRRTSSTSKPGSSSWPVPGHSSSSRAGSTCRSGRSTGWRAPVALTTASSVSPAAGSLAGLAVGLAVGIANGIIVTRFNINCAHRDAGDDVRRERHRGDRDQGQPSRGPRSPGLPGVRRDGLHRDLQCRLDDDRDRDPRDDPAQPNGLRALRLRDRREHTGGAAGRRPGGRGPRRRPSP